MAASQVVVTVDVSPSCSLAFARKEVESEDNDDAVDPYLFDDEYTVACSTGFVLWEGAWCLVQAMREARVPPVAGLRVVELGAGAGLAGMYAAARGAHVLLTDVAPVVEGSLEPNVKRNANTSPAAAAAAAAAAADGQNGAWIGALPVGEGTAAAQPLNWSKDVSAQCKPNDPRSRVDIILAAECVWLVDILDEFLDTLKALLADSPSASAFVSYCDRSSPGSKSFVSSRRLWDGCVSREMQHEVVYVGDAPEAKGKTCEVHRVWLGTQQ
ncbi:tRNA methyltransferase 10-like a-like protein [Pycnococcus provasolii]